MDIMGLMRQAQELKKNYEQLQVELEAMTSVGAAGGGLVTAEVNGLGQLRRLKVDPSVTDPAHIEMLEDLIVVAVGEAQKKAAAEHAARTAKLGENLPFKLPF